jgi:hypothetical protein
MKISRDWQYAIGLIVGFVLWYIITSLLVNLR